MGKSSEQQPVCLRRRTAGSVMFTDQELRAPANTPLVPPEQQASVRAAQKAFMSKL